MDFQFKDSFVDRDRIRVERILFSKEEDDEFLEAFSQEILTSKEFIANVDRANSKCGIRRRSSQNEVVPCPVGDTEHDPSILPHTHPENTGNLSRQAAGLYHYAICRIMHGIPHRGSVRVRARCVHARAWREVISCW
ncbi:hypothetical protein M9Y10_016509 [Tritrichomonas musculus]|uniref:Uncharacterized protein n=1 Tax=Tritrichomonas musculus TaxID=1915356 RepID=A0ABR2HWH7_9EUKA